MAKVLVITDDELVYLRLLAKCDMQLYEFLSKVQNIQSSTISTNLRHLGFKGLVEMRDKVYFHITALAVEELKKIDNK